MTDQRPILRLAHSPDPDDAFMWWPLFEIDGRRPRIQSARFHYEPVMDDIESLNLAAETGTFEITAISCAQYPAVADRYALTACGASMGDSYGPKLVARVDGPEGVDDLRERGVTIAIPGTRTSAYATLCLLLGSREFEFRPMPFDRIIEAVASGECHAGVVIHEGQLTFERAGLRLLQDLGAWWTGSTNLPLPLGVNAVRRDLNELHGEGSLSEIAGDLLRSVQFAMAHREASVAYALRFARGEGAELADEFIRLYVNPWTLDFGERGRLAVNRFISACTEAGIVRQTGRIEFVGSPESAEVGSEPGR